jgi:hypothetical protein
MAEHLACKTDVRWFHNRQELYASVGMVKENLLEAKDGGGGRQLAESGCIDVV